MTNEAFINYVGSIAAKDWVGRRICLPSVVIAQAILESGWGKSELATNANALFGIKQNGWEVKTYTKAATEQRKDGTYYVVDNTKWRAYGDWEQSIIDHNDYLATREKSNGVLRYEKIIGNADYKEVCQLLKDCGYATSLTYPERLINLIEEYELSRFDKSYEESNAMKIYQCILKNNDCYKAGKKIVPKQIVVHSTGANNPSLKRYVQPDDEILGKNQYNNHWNRSGVSKCVNAFIGKDNNGIVKVYQTLPWTMRPWGCGKGKKGTYNDSAIQFEICEDALNDAKYFGEVFAAAIELCAKLCHDFNIPVTEVISHKEANSRGYASNHGDCDHWLKKFGKDMNWFRSQVAAKVNGAAVEVPDGTFKVRVTADSLNIRKGAGVLYKKVGVIKDKGVYTIVETKGNWGKLKSGAGWISLKYTTRV